ncbi:MAG: MBL fold metallo-hydrolase, partial [Myxococcales bacterium]|nr:MBL fold metallo-hydrolase [Myxococcales bacterium]
MIGASRRSALDRPGPPTGPPTGPLVGPLVGLLLVGLLACGPRPARPPAPEGPARDPAAAPSAPASPAEPATEVVLTRLGEGLWLHTSTRILEGAGPVPSHGLVVEHPEGPLLIDTAWGAEATRALLAQLEAQLGRRPRAAILTDFHDDRAGGAAVLDAAGV